MMRRIRRTPSEGLPALWKGQLITTIHSVLSNNIQPIVHTFLLISLPPAVARVELNAELELPLTSHPHPALPLGLHVAAHLLTHVFLSPLELLKTRLIVQPSSLPESKSSLSLLRDAVNKEGGLTGLYLHSHLIIPAILEHTLRPVLTLSIPLLIERQLNITPDVSPVIYSMLDLGLGLASLLVILPVETVRKRLQLQDRSFVDEDDDEDALAKQHQRKSIVRLRQKPYHGVVEAIWRIITEETTVTPRRRRRTSRGAQTVVAREGPKSGRFDGVRQLYRGVSIPFPLCYCTLHSAKSGSFLSLLVRHGRRRSFNSVRARFGQRWSRWTFSRVRMAGDLRHNIVDVNRIRTIGGL
jgi:fusion and transport protein UGO1